MLRLGPWKFNVSNIFIVFLHISSMASLFWTMESNILNGDESEGIKEKCEGYHVKQIKNLGIVRK